MRSFLSGAAALLAAMASAAPVKYTISAVGTGSLNGTGFNDSLVTIVGIGDTSNITSSSSLYQIPLTATVTVAGVGSDSFTQNIAAFAFQNGSSSAVGIGLSGYLDILDVQSFSFASYGLTAPFGPVTGNALYNYNQAFNTTGGTFVLTGVGNSTFEAEAVPEPATMGVLGLGTIGVLKRRKRA